MRRARWHLRHERGGPGRTTGKGGGGWTELPGGFPPKPTPKPPPPPKREDGRSAGVPDAGARRRALSARVPIPYNTIRLGTAGPVCGTDRATDGVLMMDSEVCVAAKRENPTTSQRIPPCHGSFRWRIAGPFSGFESSNRTCGMGSQRAPTAQAGAGPIQTVHSGVGGARPPPQ